MQNKSLRQTYLILFFTHGVSLKTWDDVGMFDREVALYRRLQDCGVRVSFVTYGDAGDLRYTNRIPDIEIHCNRWGLPPRWYARLLPLLHSRHLWRADVYKTNQTNGADVALRAARLWRKPLIARCGYMWSEFAARQQGPNSKTARHAEEVERTVFDAARRVVVTTPAMQQDVAERIPLASERTVVIPNYVDTEHFSPPVGRREEREIIFVGRLSPQKNVEALLEAVQPLEVKLTLIGDGELRAEMGARFGTLNGRVHWQGNVPNSELPHYLNRAGLFILPSHYEGHPKALIEAMACELPVIGADSPGIRELIHHGETGWLCDTNPDGIRTAIEQLLARPQLRAELGHNARQYVLEHFSLDRIVELEVTLLRELVTS